MGGWRQKPTYKKRRFPKNIYCGCFSNHRKNVWSNYVAFNVFPLLQKREVFFWVEMGRFKKNKKKRVRN